MRKATNEILKYNIFMYSANHVKFEYEIEWSLKCNLDIVQRDNHTYMSMIYRGNGKTHERE